MIREFSPFTVKRLNFGTEGEMKKRERERKNIHPHARYSKTGQGRVNALFR